ncbi:MAG: ATP-binding protein, partial [Bacilli bacterium]|nr:ATP-binding protein [Bacilli bacterium]
QCPHCGDKIYPYGKNDEAIKEKYGMPCYASLPIDPKIAHLVDSGSIEDFEGDYLVDLSKAIKKLPDNE